MTSVKVGDRITFHSAIALGDNPIVVHSSLGWTGEVSYVGDAIVKVVVAIYGKEKVEYLVAKGDVKQVVSRRPPVKVMVGDRVTLGYSESVYVVDSFSIPGSGTVLVYLSREDDDA